MGRRYIKNLEIGEVEKQPEWNEDQPVDSETLSPVQVLAMIKRDPHFRNVMREEDSAMLEKWKDQIMAERDN